MLITMKQMRHWWKFVNHVDTLMWFVFLNSYFLMSVFLSLFTHSCSLQKGWFFYGFEEESINFRISVRFAQKSCRIMKRRSKTFLKSIFILMRRFATVLVEVVSIFICCVIFFHNLIFWITKYRFVLKGTLMWEIIMMLGYVYGWRKGAWLYYLLAFTIVSHLIQTTTSRYYVMNFHWWFDVFTSANVDTGNWQT